MPPTNLHAAIESLLFSSDQPLPVGLMAEALDLAEDEVRTGLQTLGDSYGARDAGVELREIAGGWQLVTTPAQAEWVGRLLRGRKKMRLSRAALETMAIIAYKQPVTKTEVEAIRGVDSSGVLATLLERNLVTIRGRSKVVGRPLLYGTTQEFLEYFGLRDLAELPRPEELRALVAAREPEQMEMMELEVVSQVGAELAAAGPSGSAHEVLPLEDEPPTEDELAAESREQDVADEADDDGLIDDEDYLEVEAAGGDDDEEDDDEEEDDEEEDDEEEDEEEDEEDEEEDEEEEDEEEEDEEEDDEEDDEDDEDDEDEEDEADEEDDLDHEEEDDDGDDEEDDSDEESEDDLDDEDEFEDDEEGENGSYDDDDDLEDDDEDDASGDLLNHEGAPRPAQRARVGAGSGDGDGGHGSGAR